MAQVVFQFRIDSDVKSGMDSVCKELGLTPSTAYNMLARQMVRERRIPFEVSADPFYSESNMSYLNKVLDRIESGESIPKAHDIIED